MGSKRKPRDLETLRQELEQAPRPGDQIEEMLEVAAIVAEAVERHGVDPIVVGGLAVAYWAPGSYVTYDIDVVMPSVPAVELTLESLGFQKKGRFWVLPDRKVFFEAPGSLLEPDEGGFEVIELPSGRKVRVQSPEDVLLLRLEEFVATGHSDVFQQCLWLIGSAAIDGEKLSRRAEAEGLQAALDALEAHAKQVAQGVKLPEMWELKGLAKRLRDR